jgi:hypothetical protein
VEGKVRRMASRKARCTVVEIPASSQGGPDDAPPRDLLPWADPYILRLLNLHRLQAALDDSISFVEHEAAGRPLVARRMPCEAAAASSGPIAPRFDLDHPFSD